MAEASGRGRGPAVGSLVVRGDGEAGTVQGPGEAVVAERVLAEAVGDVHRTAARPGCRPAVGGDGYLVVVDHGERLGHARDCSGQ